MENAPMQPEADGAEAKSSKSSKKKKKRAEALGIFAVEPKRVAESSDTESTWEKLTLTKRRAGQTETVTPLAEALQAEEQQRLPEVDDAHLESLTPDEEQFVVAQIVKANAEPGTSRSAEPTHDQRRVEETEGPAIDEAEAVALFHEDLLEGKPLEQAFQDGLARLESPAAGRFETTAPEPAAETSTTGNPEEPGRPGLSNEKSRISEREPFERQQPRSEMPLVAEQTEGDDREPSPLNQGQTPITGSASGGGMPPVSGGFMTNGNRYSGLPASVPASPNGEKLYTGGDVMSAALLGGILGYLIGRRRGRIKTERKLKPIQKKLEKKVKNLQEDIRWKEFYIRKAAHERARDEQRIFDMERMHKKVDRKQEESRQVASESAQLHGKKVTPERIGKVLVAVGSEQRKKTERSKQLPTKNVNKRVATMSRSELLELSEKISVENTTLRQVYETHLVSEQALRRLMNEYIGGGDVQKALRRELLEHEIDFERDPILRDKAKPSVEKSSPSGNETLQQLLQKANVLSEADAHDELAVLKARQTHHEKQRQQQQKYRRVLDISMVTAIAVLFGLVVMLLLTS